MSETKNTGGKERDGVDRKWRKQGHADLLTNIDLNNSKQPVN
jgi:hypothetical protein